jgi:tetratricopeptide (TPR) repeat protein
VAAERSAATFSLVASVTTQDIRQRLELAAGHHRAGQLGEAESLYRAILRDAPGQVDAMHLLGLIANSRGEHAAAIELLRQAVAAKPGFVEARINLAVALKGADRLDEAERECRAVIAAAPGPARAHYALGSVLHQAGKLAAAAEAYKAALARDPAHIQALSNLGAVELALGRVDEAAQHHEIAAAARPDLGYVHYNLGLARQEQGRPVDAIACYRRARALDSSADGQLTADASWNEALQHLALGHYDEGWQLYEWRWRQPSYPARRFADRQWDGAALAGRTILVTAEQGHGDLFQFVRYAPLLKARGARVIFECPQSLVAVLGTVPGIDRLVAQGEPVPDFDCHAPMLSLPRLLEITRDPVPADIPYVTAGREAAAAWRAKLPATGLNAGLVWRGNPDNSDDRKRSMTADVVAALVRVSGISWLSLQVDARAGEIATLSEAGDFRQAGIATGDWMETAAAISALDLVVTVDTAVAHLAGAMGKPVWVVLSVAPHWCWLRDRDDSPWYPSARLFRKTVQGDWLPVVHSLEQALHALGR